eukprot:7815101-Pyramimonas_sp.AAC.1
MANPSPGKSRSYAPPTLKERGAPPRRKGFLLQGPDCTKVCPVGSFLNSERGRPCLLYTSDAADDTPCVDL